MIPTQDDFELEMYQRTNKSLLFQLEIPRGRGHLAKMPEQGSCSAGFPTIPINLYSACCLEFGQRSFKSLFIRSSPFITHQASKSCRSLGFGRFLAFSPLVTRIPLVLYFLCAFRRDLRVLWAEDRFLLCLAWALHHRLEHSCSCRRSILGEH